jgi:thymidylate synthase
MSESVNPFDDSYHDMLARILREGIRKADRTGTGTLAIFGHFQEFDLSKGFPLITTKKIHTKSIIHELLWMISGSTNIEYLKDNGVKIWDEWADKHGDIGPGYGKQWRKWVGYEPRVEFQADRQYPVVNGTYIKTEVDQIAQIVERLRGKPWDRRNMVSAWNVGEVHRMNLPACHFNAQFNVEPKDPIVGYDAHVAAGDVDPVPHKLNCVMNIRSWDTFLGGPFNIAQYALLTMMFAQVAGLEPGLLKICSGDTHLYINHLEQARLQLSRKPFSPPRMVLDPSIKEIDDFKYEHFTLEGYEHHPHIKGDVSV